MKYALEIRKSDLPLLAVLNGGVEPKVEKTKTFLIVDPEGHNEIVTLREFHQNYDISSNSPLLLKLKK